ncbi:hypothetical protein DVH05_024879 [Phytophthora capsici]|nr:hypothetical protein DVH05_024879 [Phytophthora capsici]
MMSDKILSSGTAIYQKDFAFPATMTFDETLKIIHLRFDIGNSLQFSNLPSWTITLRGLPHFKSLPLTLMDPQTSGAALGTTKDTVVRIKRHKFYDYDEGVALAKIRWSLMEHSIIRINGLKPLTKIKSKALGVITHTVFTSTARRPQG